MTNLFLFRTGNRCFQVVCFLVLTADGSVQLATLKPDFMFAPAGAVSVWQREGIEAYRIATRKNALAKEAGKSVGSVFVALKSRSDLNDIKDLKDKVVVAGLPDSVPGWRRFSATSYLYPDTKELINDKNRRSLLVSVSASAETGKGGVIAEGYCDHDYHNNAYFAGCCHDINHLKAFDVPY